jgi:integrase/recombinase XerD
MTLSKAITEFIREMRSSKAPATVAAYESDLRRMAKHAKLDTVLHFTRELLRAYFEWESYQGAKMSTLHRKQAAIRKFAQWCITNRIISADADPMRGMEKIERPQTLPRPFSPGEVERLWTLDLKDEQQRLLRALLFFTGMRVSAIAGIRIGDIGTEPPTIRTTGKRGRTQLIHLHPKLAELVVGYVLAHTDLKPQALLLAHNNGKGWRRKYIETLTKEWGKAAHVTSCLPHRFRHTFGTNLLEACRDLRLVQEALGHADIKSTTIYTKVTDERLRGAITALPASWGGPGSPAK